MESGAIEVSSFVRYFPEGRMGDSHVAFVQGILGQVLSILVISRREPLLVTTGKCELISPDEVTGGLMELIAHHKEFGEGEIIGEARIDNLLWVILLGHDGETSGLVPLTEVSLCCACC